MEHVNQGSKRQIKLPAGAVPVWLTMAALLTMGAVLTPPPARHRGWRPELAAGR